MLDVIFYIRYLLLLDNLLCSDTLLGVTTNTCHVDTYFGVCTGNLLRFDTSPADLDHTLI